MEAAIVSKTFKELFSSYPFWLLLIGSLCSIGSIGAVNFHMKFVFLDAGFTKGAMVDSTWRTASILILWSSIGGRLSIGYFADRFSKKWVMFTTYFIVAATIPLLLAVRPGAEMTLYAFAILFGFGMGADYMMIPLMAAEQFGINTLARAMAVIIPVNTIGQTWFPYLVSILREHFGGYGIAMSTVLCVALLGAVAIGLLPSRRNLDARVSGAFIGAFIGLFVGYLLRPSTMLGQLPFDVVISRGATLEGLSQVFVPVAQASFNVLLAGLTVGAVAGALVGRFWIGKRP